MIIGVSADTIPHDDVIKWKHFPRYWSFVRGIHRSPVNSPHIGQWRGALMLSLICALNKRLSKQSWGWWFETPSRSLWRHCSDITRQGHLQGHYHIRFRLSRDIIHNGRRDPALSHDTSSKITQSPWTEGPKVDNIWLKKQQVLDRCQMNANLFLFLSNATSTNGQVWWEVYLYSVFLTPGGSIITICVIVIAGNQCWTGPCPP